MALPENHSFVVAYGVEVIYDVVPDDVAVRVYAWVEVVSDDPKGIYGDSFQRLQLFKYLHKHSAPNEAARYNKVNFLLICNRRCGWWWRWQWSSQRAAKFSAF